MNQFFESLTPYILALFTIIASLGKWFYNLIEKRINARIAENKDLEQQIYALREEYHRGQESIVKLETKITMIEEYQEKGFGQLRSLIVDKMDGLEKLLTEKIKNTQK